MSAMCEWVCVSCIIQTTTIKTHSHEQKISYKFLRGTHRDEKKRDEENSTFQKGVGYSNAHAHIHSLTHMRLRKFPTLTCVVAYAVIFNNTDQATGCLWEKFQFWEFLDIDRMHMSFTYWRVWRKQQKTHTSNSWNSTSFPKKVGFLSFHSMTQNVFVFLYLFDVWWNTPIFVTLFLPTN